MGKAIAHADPRMWHEHSNYASGAVPRSFSLAQVETLPEISQSRRDSLQPQKVAVDDETFRQMKRDKEFIHKVFTDKERLQLNSREKYNPNSNRLTSKVDLKQPTQFHEETKNYLS